MIERRGLRTKPGWTPSPLPNFSLYPILQLLPASSPLMSGDTKYAHARIQEFLPRCVCVCVGGGGVQVQLPEISSDNVFFLIIYLFFFSALLILQRVSNGYFKENNNFPRFQRGPTFSGGGPAFSRGV